MRRAVNPLPAQLPGISSWRNDGRSYKNVQDLHFLHVEWTAQMDFLGPHARQVRARQGNPGNSLGLNSCYSDQDFYWLDFSSLKTGRCKQRQHLLRNTVSTQLIRLLAIEMASYLFL